MITVCKLYSDLYGLGCGLSWVRAGINHTDLPGSSRINMYPQPNIQNAGSYLYCRETRIRNTYTRWRTQENECLTPSETSILKVRTPILVRKCVDDVAVSYDVMVVQI